LKAAAINGFWIPAFAGMTPAVLLQSFINRFFNQGEMK